MRHVIVNDGSCNHTWEKDRNEIDSILASRAVAAGGKLGAACGPNAGNSWAKQITLRGWLRLALPPSVTLMGMEKSGYCQSISRRH